MIICYYPGAGGNRYLAYLQNKDYTKSGISYDKTYLNHNVLEIKYLNNNTIYDYTDNKILMLHCLNYEKIKYHFPKCDKFIFLKSEFKKSLRRQWALEGKNMYIENKKTNSKIELYNQFKKENWPNISNEEDLKTLPEYIKILFQKIVYGDVYFNSSKFDDINSAFSSICFHHEYYKKFPVNLENYNVEVVDFYQKNAFTDSMNKELDLYQNKIFDFAWDVYIEHGPNAPILTLFLNNFEL